MPESSGKNNILIVGAGGRMGAALARHYRQDHQVTALRRTDLDVTKVDTLRPTLAPLEFDTLIYTAGLTNVDQCEDQPEEARLCNAETPKILAQICAEKGARLIHISTDYVFDGRKNLALTETEPPNPLSVYGKTKLAGETAVLKVSPHFLVIRVSWLFGPDRPSFPDMILKNALAQDHVAAIADKVSCPTYSEDLASWIEPMLSDNRYCGLLHLSNSGSTNWQAYGQATLDIAAELGLPLKATKVDALYRADFPIFKAERPEFTAFDTSKYTKLSSIVPRNWQDALRDYLQKQYQSSARFFIAVSSIVAI
ncbi:dTDP-4-dehydrorhamnose reductase [Phragmitibacter flavus]|uniref:dTDP-4-dehydrorhamnose reductase n=1 Tax=Phragmitibacter flavus TaxID=2576071 RepID=A0A5R8KJT2_9BACT|nr:dTDP-4-dehydrorhamnose reductase [Phragmitibacter flavus]TLD72195.1 dTDP-4-dehydrorhamnose reductase [Phragmitibacter flavus]